jgi:hypothetical protein
MYTKDMIHCTVEQKNTLSVDDMNLFSIPMDTDLVMSSIRT